MMMEKWKRWMRACPTCTFRRIAIMFLLPASAFANPASVSRVDDQSSPELSREFLSLVSRHLYRWYLDETAMLVIDDTDEIEFFVRRLTPELDAGDHSIYLELLVPQLSFALTLKKAAYEVPELGVEIANEDFRIIRAQKVDHRPEDLSSCRRIVLSKKDTLDYLFRMRNQREYPDAELLERMRAAVRAQYLKLLDHPAPGPQILYVAPISRVSNNLWVFWENERRIMRFSSDTDISSKAFWQYEKLGVEVYDLEKDVVVSIAEVPGSNAYVTRDWAARVLYNCVVFGQRMIMHPASETVPPEDSQP